MVLVYALTKTVTPRQTGHAADNHGQTLTGNNLLKYCEASFGEKRGLSGGFTGFSHSFLAWLG